MISDVGISWLASGCPSIQELDITKCKKVTDISLRAIGASLFKLTKIKLQYCENISNVGLRHLTQSCTELKELDLRMVAHISDGTKYGEFGAEGIPAVAQRCKNLQIVNLSGCYRVQEVSNRMEILHFKLYCS